MTLDEAIKHCKEKAEELRNPFGWKVETVVCVECAKEHEQLAEWLEELKEWHIRKEMSENMKVHSVILDGKPYFITKGHVEAMLEYENKQIVKEFFEQEHKTIERIISIARGGCK